MKSSLLTHLSRTVKQKELTVLLWALFELFLLNESFSSRYGQKSGVIETPQCWWCGQAEQSVEQLYTKCRRWRKERRKLIRSLHTEGISWQGRAERKGLAELLANEKAVGPLLEFLKSTEVGGREGAREKEPEWERRNDQTGEELLED